jgi:coenzyme F420 hydrogenase subunit beta
MRSKGVSTPTQVVEADLCIGCGVCAVAFPRRVEMALHSDGFIVPREVERLTDTERDLFVQFCPGVGYRAPRQREGGSVRDPMWGLIVESRDAWASDDESRRKASSGGALTALLAYLLSSGKVDAVVATTASVSDPFRNVSVAIRGAGDARLISGSRYSPVSPFQALLTVSPSERVAVVGKPCDIAAIRLLSASGKVELPRIEYFLSFFCAGTPSWRGTEQAVDSLGVEKRLVKTISYRGNGWPGDFSVEDVTGGHHAMTYEESWGTILNKHLHNRCKTCQDGMGVYADIVAADSWDVDQDGYPMFTQKDGRSFLITRSIRGEDLVKRALSAQSLEGSKTEIGRLLTIQPSQVSRKKFAAARALGFRLAGRRSPRFPGFPRWRWAIREPLKALRQGVGSFKRAAAAVNRRQEP